MVNEPSLDQLAIYSLLKLHPNSMYVTPDGNHLYILAVNEEGTEGLLDIEYIYSENGKRFDEMNESELNEFLAEYLEGLIG